MASATASSYVSTVCDAKFGDYKKITPAFLTYFNDKKTKITNAIAAVRKATAAISELTQNASEVDVKATSKKGSDLQSHLKTASKNAADGKRLLDEMKSDGDALAKKDAEDKDKDPKSFSKSERLDPYYSQYLVSCKEYVNVMKEHQKAKEANKKASEDTMLRRGMIASGDTMSADEIREGLKSNPKLLEQMTIQQQKPSRAATQALEDARSRQRDIADLVASINEVAEMFNDFAALVQQQSEMLDSIEQNVEAAETYVRKGNDNLRSAIDMQKKNRKCVCCMLVCGIIVVIALVTGLGTGLTGVFKSV